MGGGGPRPAQNPDPGAHLARYLRRLRLALRAIRVAVGVAPGAAPGTAGEVDPRMRPSPVGLFARGGRLRPGILRGDLPSGAGRNDGQVLGQSLPAGPPIRRLDQDQAESRQKTHLMKPLKSSGFRRACVNQIVLVRIPTRDLEMRLRNSANLS